MGGSFSYERGTPVDYLRGGFSVRRMRRLETGCRSSSSEAQRQSLPRQSARGGHQTSISPQRQWLSKVETAHMRGFEGFYPLHHFGVEYTAS